MEQWVFPSPDSWHEGVKLLEQTERDQFPLVSPSLRFWIWVFCLQTLSLSISVHPLFISRVMLSFSWYKEYGNCSKAGDCQDWETTGINFPLSRSAMFSCCPPKSSPPQCCRRKQPPSLPKVPTCVAGEGLRKEGEMLIKWDFEEPSSTVLHKQPLVAFTAGKNVPSRRGCLRFLFVCLFKKNASGVCVQTLMSHLK